jgi:hypothetical protein
MKIYSAYHVLSKDLPDFLQSLPIELTIEQLQFLFEKYDVMITDERKEGRAPRHGSRFKGEAKLLLDNKGGRFRQR